MFKKLISFTVLFAFLFTSVGPGYLSALPRDEEKYCLRVPGGFPKSEKEIEGIKKTVTEKVKELSGALKKIYGEETGIDNIKFVKEEGKYWFVRVNVYENLLTINTASSQIPFSDISTLINKIFFHEFAEKFIYGKFGYDIAHYPFLKLGNIKNKIDNEYSFIPAFGSRINKDVRSGIFKDKTESLIMAGFGDVVSEKIARGLFVMHNYGTSDDFIRENELYQRILVKQCQGKQIRDEIKDKFFIDLAVKVAVLKEQEEIAKASVLKSSIQETIANLKNLADKIYQQKDKKVEPLKEKLLDLLRIMEEKNRMQSFDDFKKKLGENEFNNNELNNEFMRLAGIIEKKKPELFPETVYYTRRIIFNQLVSDFQELYARTELKVKPLITTRKIKLKSGIKLAYRSLERPDAKGNVVFIHGLGGSKEYWLDSLEYYHRLGYNVYALDLKGYGQSDKPKSLDSPYTLEGYADELNEFMGKMNISQATIFGHSMGGNIGIQFLNKYKEKVTKLVLVGTTITPESEKVLDMLQEGFTWQAVLLKKIFSLLTYLPFIRDKVNDLVFESEENKELIDEFFEPDPPNPQRHAPSNPKKRHIIVGEFLRLQKDAVEKCLAILMDNKKYWYTKILRENQDIPMVYIYGEKSKNNEERKAADLIKIYNKNLMVLGISGVKHCAMITKSQEFNKISARALGEKFLPIVEDKKSSVMSVKKFGPITEPRKRLVLLLQSL